MPSPRVINTTPDKPEPTHVEKFFSKLGKDYQDKADRVEIGNLLSQYEKNRDDANAYEDLQLGLEKSNISPTKRIQTQQSLNEMRKTINERDKALNSKVNKNILTNQEKIRQRENLLKAGWPDYAADVYLDAPPGVKQTLEREHVELTARGFRKPLVGVPEGVDKGIPSEISPVSEKKEEEWSQLPIPTNITPSEKVKWENNNQKENNSELKKTQEKKKGYRTNQILIDSMYNINESGKLPEGLSRLLIDPKTGDLRDIAQVKGVNKETALYSKNLKQFLKGAKEQFGAKVSNFEASTFLQQLPGLLNTQEGKRLILKQMMLSNELESIHNNELDSALKKYGRNASYSDITAEVDRRVEEKEEKLIGQINQVVEASDYLDQMAKNPDKFRGTVLMEKEGNFKAVRKEDFDKAKAKGWNTY